LRRFSHRSDSLTGLLRLAEDRYFNPGQPIKSRADNASLSYKNRDHHQVPFNSRHHHHLPLPLQMPKRKLPSSSTPPQPSLKHFLPSRKSLLPLSKRAKLIPPPQTKEASPPSCLNSPSTEDLVQLFQYIDEVLLFSGKPLLWSRIQEEVFSLHKRYAPTPPFATGLKVRSIEVEILRRIVAVMQGVYEIEIGWKRNGEGNWKADYKLSIPGSESNTPDQPRLSRFQTALVV